MGTTTRYARTRRDLLVAALGRLRSRFEGSVQVVPTDHIADDRAAVEFIASSLELMVSREVDQVAAILLRIELRNDPELRCLVDAASEPQENVLQHLAGILSNLGVDEPVRRASELLVMFDGILLAKIAAGRDISIRNMVSTYLSGVRAQTSPSQV
ncbi:hypothetical protein [Serinibacter arcticus]|nr:hypothetical protein [Serinibacter arcticus]